MKKRLLFVSVAFLAMTNVFNGSVAQSAVAAPFYCAPTATYTFFPETFESGTKTTYTYGAVTLSTGDWGMDDALIGTSASDKKKGSKAVRIENTGKLTMLFDIASGVSKVNILHAVFGTDTASAWGLWYSVNSGTTWAQAGSNITSASSALNQTTFTINLQGTIRFEIRKVNGGRLNIDNISIVDNAGICCCGCGGTDTLPTRDDNMAMGNPSGATTSTSTPDNYLMVKSQYALSYNNSNGMANWVSWHLSLAWKGSAERCDCFTQDATLPSTFFKASTSDYTGTGFDRGHLCPSDDRDSTDTDNAATFKMTNISPQAPQLNENTWGALETYCRTLITQGKELYIIAGGYGTGGSGSSGGTTNSIASGSINVPSHFWKVVVVLSTGSNDVSRVSTATRVIAVDMPNVQTVTDHTWGYYRTSVDAIEAATGYDFLSNVPTSIQAVIEAAVDTGATF